MITKVAKTHKLTSPVNNGSSSGTPQSSELVLNKKNKVFKKKSSAKNAAFVLFLFYLKSYLHRSKAYADHKETKSCPRSHNARYLAEALFLGLSFQLPDGRNKRKRVRFHEAQ
jgi:hypothetical protein